MPLDERDQRIVDALAEDAWLSYVELGQRVNLSASAAQRRVEKLIAGGVILGARARIAPHASGRPLRLYVLVQLRDESKALIGGFVRRLSGREDLVEAHYVAGSADIILVLQTASMESYAAFAEQHLNSNPHVRRYETLTSLRSLC